MPRYVVTFTDSDATYPAPKQNVTVECSKDEVWTLAMEQGFVQKIYNLDALQTVFSIHWNHNALGLSQAQLNKNLEF